MQSIIPSCYGTGQQGLAKFIQRKMNLQENIKITTVSLLNALSGTGNSFDLLSLTRQI